MQTIKFDEIAALTAKISKEFGPWSEPIHVTQEKINQFADVTGDHQWIHIDIERCKKESPFGGPVAHGFLTLSLLPAFKTTEEYAVTGHDGDARDGNPGSRSAEAGGGLRRVDAVREVSEPRGEGDQSMAYEQIIYEVADNIATITLNRP